MTMTFSTILRQQLMHSSTISFEVFGGVVSLPDMKVPKAENTLQIQQKKVSSLVALVSLAMAESLEKRIEKSVPTERI